MTCNRCEKRFSEEEAEYEFSLEYPLKNYANFNQCLCGECAIAIISEEESGVYMETCENCSCEFDWFEEDSTYRSHTRLDIGLEDLSKILCSDCALELESEDYPSEDENSEFCNENECDDED